MSLQTPDRFHAAAVILVDVPNGQAQLVSAQGFESVGEVPNNPGLLFLPFSQQLAPEVATVTNMWGAPGIATEPSFLTPANTGDPDIDALPNALLMTTDDPGFAYYASAAVWETEPGAGPLVSVTPAP